MLALWGSLLSWPGVMNAQAIGEMPAAGPEPAAPALNCPDLTLGPVVPPAPDRSQAPIVIYARELEAAKADLGEARGDVDLYRADQHLSTDRILYDPESELLMVPGRIDYEDQQVWFRGENANYSFQTESGRVDKINYGLTGSSANGHAEFVELFGGNTSILHVLDYTTCPDNAVDWQLQARELELRHDEGVGYARGAKLTFKGVPILYAPWFTFPLDDRRKSGFLYPNFGHSNDLGFDVSAPWYWNIAPNQDAIIEPRYFSARGYMLSGDYRFLTRKTLGGFDWDYMPHDRETDQDRYRYLLEHYGSPRNNWRSSIIVDRVGDDDYYQDFGTSLGQTSRQFLRSSAELHGVGRYWDMVLMADDYQVIDDSVLPENEPYTRLPRLLYWSDRPLTDNGLSLKFDSEIVYFDRSLGTTGARVDLLPTAYWDLQNSWGFVRPALGYRFTAYDLDLHGEPGSDSPSTGTPIMSFDSGLVFDRHLADGDLQTLEPRVFYLYVPERQQSDQPLFDTGEFTFGYSQLFNTNRFAGGDRQGDANQVSVAVSTRRFDGATGRVLWSLHLGQIFYFAPQRVQLHDNAPEFDEDYSPFLAEFRWQPLRRISGVAGLQWDWQRDQLELGMVGLRYDGSRGQRAMFEYRYRRDRVDQFDLRLFWPINERWRSLARINYSFADSDILEFQAGLEYESCCWALRTVLRRYLRNRDGDYRDGIYIELNLKGLASIGTRAAELFGN